MAYPISNLAARIILEKDESWEYKLTAEILRLEIAPIIRDWHALCDGIVVQTSQILPKDQALSWIAAKFQEAEQIASAFDRLINEEFVEAWSEPGVAGVDAEIVSTCRLFGGVCQAALNWEREVRVTRIDDIFAEPQELMIGLSGRMIDEAAKFLDFIHEIFSQSNATGVHQLSLVIDLPNGWLDEFMESLQRAKQFYVG